MRRRKVLDDNEWGGWLQWMRNCFRKGTIGETWKQLEQDRWFNPAFQNFINKEIIGASGIRTLGILDYYDGSRNFYPFESSASIMAQNHSGFDYSRYKKWSLSESPIRE